MRHTLAALSLVVTILVLLTDLQARWLVVCETTLPQPLCGCYFRLSPCKHPNALSLPTAPANRSASCTESVSFDLDKLLQVVSTWNRPLYTIYAGDSILRCAYEQYIVQVSKSYSPAQVMPFNVTWYHNQQVFCCWPLIGQAPSCVWARQGVEFSGTAHEQTAVL